MGRDVEGNGRRERRLRPWSGNGGPEGEAHGSAHPAIEEFERMYLGVTLEPERQDRRTWLPGTMSLYRGDPARDRAYVEGWGPYAGVGSRHYRRPRERIEEEVHEVLTREPELDASGIIVNVNEEGDVTLTGFVTHKADKRLAEDLVADVYGVGDVHNRVKIRR